MSYLATVLSIAIHKPTDSPLFGDDLLRIRLDDNGGGAFLVFSREDSGEELRMDFEEFMEAYYRVMESWQHLNPELKTPETEQLCDD